MPELQQACPMPFDEGRLWKGADSAVLMAEVQSAFQNITRIMDCVGCEKCKLWGKLQTLGEQQQDTFSALRRVEHSVSFCLVHIALLVMLHYIAS